MYVSNPSLNHDKQMIIPFNITEKVQKIMGYGKQSNFFTYPNFITFSESCKSLNNSEWVICFIINHSDQYSDWGGGDSNSDIF